MGYSNKIKEEAFGVYCAKPVDDFVAKEMQRRHPDTCAKLSRHTVGGWVKKYNWEARMEVIVRKTQDKLDAKRISTRAELINELWELEKELIQEARNVSAKSKEGATNAAIALSNHILELKGEKGAAKGIDGNELEKVIAVIFEVLSGDEKVANYLMRNQDIILEQIPQRLDEND